MEFGYRNGNRVILSNKDKIKELKAELDRIDAYSGYFRDEMRTAVSDECRERRLLEQKVNRLFEHLGLEDVYVPRHEVDAHHIIVEQKKSKKK